MEYELLERLIATGKIKDINYLQVQFHRTMESDKRMYEIQYALRETHELMWQYRYVWESWRLKAK